VIDKLEYLLALARELHFGRAAEACGVTQPTFSAGIKQLEETLGVLLVRRGSRFHSFTPEGERTLDWARRIVGDSRAMRQEIRALKTGLAGHLTLAAIPSALTRVAALTTPYRARHPGVSFSVLQRTSIEILAQIENLELDAGLTYIDNEPVGRLRAVPLYREDYRLVIAADGPLGDRAQVGWGELGELPLCLPTPDMQYRRIVDRLLRAAGVEPVPRLESNSMLVLLTHVRTGQWAGIMPAAIVDSLSLGEALRAVPIVGNVSAPTIGLLIPQREPVTPLVAALVAEARRLAATLTT
jgi:DNA-binding transcriptional LysR family regulator